jgi:hypothetical protein
MVAFYLASNRKDEENKFTTSNKFRKYFQIISGTGDGNPTHPFVGSLASDSDESDQYAAQK